MPTLEEILQKLRHHREALARDWNITWIGVFGSYARGEATPESDLDLLVDFSEAPGFVRFFALEEHLSELLGVRVDLVTRKGLKPQIGQNILREVIPV